MSKQTHSANNWASVVVTGAGSGIGLRLAEILAEQGSSVVALDRAFSNQAKSRLSEAGEFVVYITGDISDAESMVKKFADTAAQTGPFDLVINCAGVQCAKTFDELSSDDFNQVINVNLIGSRNVAAAALPHMIKGSRLIFISSLAGLTYTYGYAAYNASKWGVMGLAGALRLEYKPSGIGISVVCPPEFDSPLVVEERKTAPALTFKMKALAGSLTLNEVATAILIGANKGKDTIIPGRMARVVAFIARHFPSVMQAASHKMVADGLRAEQNLKN